MAGSVLHIETQRETCTPENYYNVYSAICGPNCGSHTVISPLNILVTSRCWGQNSVSQRTIEQKFFFIHFFYSVPKFGKRTHQLNILCFKILNYFLLFFLANSTIFNHHTTLLVPDQFSFT